MHGRRCVLQPGARGGVLPRDALCGGAGAGGGALPARPSHPLLRHLLPHGPL